MQAASYLYSLAHPELIASIQYYIFYLFWPLPYGNYRKSTSVLAGIIALLLAIHVIYLGFPLIGLSPSGDNYNHVSASSYGISG